MNTKSNEKTTTAPAMNQANGIGLAPGKYELCLGMSLEVRDGGDTVIVNGPDGKVTVLKRKGAA